MTRFSNYHPRASTEFGSGIPDCVDDGLVGFSKHHSRKISRFIEFSFAFLAALLILSVISFLTLRPTLKEIRGDARAQWESMVSLARERNELLPSVVEILKGFGVIQSKWAEKMLEERSILSRASDPDAIISSIDDTDQRLAKIDQLADSSKELKNHILFVNQWARINAMGRELKIRRTNYNETAKMYNSLLTPFPQNMVATIFGFVPLNRYPLANVPRPESIRLSSIPSTLR